MIRTAQSIRPIGKRALNPRQRELLRLLRVERNVAVFTGTDRIPDRLAQEFRGFVERYGGEISDNPEGAFSGSGTNVRTVIVVIRKGAGDGDQN